MAITSKDKMKELAATNPNARMLEQAPLTIVVCGDMQKALEGEGRQNSRSRRTSGSLRTYRITSLEVRLNLSTCSMR